MRATFHRRYWLWVILTAAIIAGVVLWIESREPHYQGVPASEYVLQALTTPRLNNVEIAARLRPMGTNVAVAALVQVLERDLSRWRQWYAAAYVKFPPRIRKYLPGPKSNRLVAHMSLFTLAQFGPSAEPALPVVLQIYQRDDGMLKSAALNVLSALGPQARPALPMLLADLNSTNQQHYRLTTVQALPRIDPSGELSAATLIPLLIDKDVYLARAAVVSLSKMAGPSPHLVSNLWVGLRRPEVSICEEAAQALKAHGALTREGIEPFLQQLEGSEISTRATAATVLTHGGQFAPEVVPALRRAAHDANEKVREAALKSLAGLAWESSVTRTCRLDAAREVIRNGAENWSWLTMDILPNLLPDSAALVPLLASALEHPSSRVRGKAAQTLGKLGPAAEDAVPALLKSTADEWLNVREAATNALRAIEPGRR